MLVIYVSVTVRLGAVWCGSVPMVDVYPDDPCRYEQKLLKQIVYNDICLRENQKTTAEHSLCLAQRQNMRRFIVIFPHVEPCYKDPHRNRQPRCVSPLTVRALHKAITIWRL